MTIAHRFIGNAYNISGADDSDEGHFVQKEN